MTQTDPTEVPAADAPAGRKRPWLIWVILGAALLVVLIVLAIVLLIPQGEQRPVAHPTPTPSASSASPVPTLSPTPTPTATPTASATPLPFVTGQFTSDMPGYLGDVLNSQNTSVLAEGGTFSDPVYIEAAHADTGESVTPDDAVSRMDFMFTPEDPNPWNLALPDSTLAQFRSGPYGSFFPVGAIVAESHDGHVFSFIGHDKTITAVFMSASEGFLH